MTKAKINEEMTVAKEEMIKVIRRYQYYEPGDLEKLPKEMITEMYNDLINWILGIG